MAKPDFVDNLVPAEEVRGVKIDEAFLGSCNNGRIEDLRVGASIIKGKKVAEKFVSLWFRQARPLSPGTEGRSDRHLYGSWSNCYEPELQRMLGKLSGRDR